MLYCLFTLFIEIIYFFIILKNSLNLNQERKKK